MVCGGFLEKREVRVDVIEFMRTRIWGGRVAVRLLGVVFSLSADALEACVEGRELVVSCVVFCDGGSDVSGGSFGLGKSSSMIFRLSMGSLRGGHGKGFTFSSRDNRRGSIEGHCSLCALVSGKVRERKVLTSSSTLLEIILEVLHRPYLLPYLRFVGCDVDYGKKHRALREVRHEVTFDASGHCTVISTPCPSLL